MVCHGVASCFVCCHVLLDVLCFIFCFRFPSLPGTHAAAKPGRPQAAKPPRDEKAATPSGSTAASGSTAGLTGRAYWVAAATIESTILLLGLFNQRFNEQWMGSSIFKSDAGLLSCLGCITLHFKSHSFTNKC